MFAPFVDTLRREAAILRAVLGTHDRLRSVIDSGVGAELGADDNLLNGIIEGAPPLLEWRIYDHCASITRLYAVYEQCITDMVAEWLRILPSLFPTYADLPEAVRTGHRTGVSEILSRLGGDRYGHLSEQMTLIGISDGVRGVTPYLLLADAFFVDDQNLRREALAKLLTKVGLPDAWGWICNHGDIQRFLHDVRGGGNTAEGELKNFVAYRNEAAHGAVDQVLATDEINKIADFVVILCSVIAQIFTRQVVDRRLQTGNAEVIGRVFRQFSGCIIAIEAVAALIRVGDAVIVRREQACFATSIESIEVNHVRHTQLNMNNGDQVGLCLGQPAKVDSEIIRLRDSDDLTYEI